CFTLPEGNNGRKLRNWIYGCAVRVCNNRRGSHGTSFWVKNDANARITCATSGPLPVLQDLARRVSPARPRETRSGMGAGAPNVESLNGSAISRPTEQRTHGKKLVECDFAVEDVTSGQTIGFLKVEWCDHL